MTPELEAASRILVDGNNVMGARADGWWRDRRAAADRLTADLARWAGETGVEVTVVFDGAAPPPSPPGAGAGAVTVRYAGRSGPDAADDVITSLVAADPAFAAEVTVVTADRALRARVEAAGARTVGPRALLAVLDRGEPGGRADVGSR